MAETSTEVFTEQNVIKLRMQAAVLDLEAAKIRLKMAQDQERYARYIRTVRDAAPHG